MQRAQPGRQTFELPGVQRRETPAHRELRSVRLREAELAGPHEGAGERRVASAGPTSVTTDANRLRGLGEVEREPLGRAVEPGDETSHQPGRARPHDTEPEQLDVVRPWIEAERVDHRIDPGHHLHHVARQRELHVFNLRRHCCPPPAWAPPGHHQVSVYFMHLRASCQEGISSDVRK